MRVSGFKDLKCPYCGYDGSDLSIGREPIAMGHFFSYLDCSKCKERFRIVMEKEK